MAKIYYDKDANLSLLKNKLIGIIGWGSQGHAQSQNLRDSGCNVIVGEVPNSVPWKAAKKAGFEVLKADEVVRRADIIVLLVPDDFHAQVFRDYIQPNLTEGKVLQFASGFNIYYHQVVPPPNVDVTMVAPRIHGVLLRKLFVEKQYAPASVAVHQNVSGKALQLALAYAKGIGCTKAGVLESTFKEETVCDLFNEHCGILAGVMGVIKVGWEELVRAGYTKEAAYFELFHELKAVADLINAYGVPGMLRRCSMTAQYGGMLSQYRMGNDAVRMEMRKIIKELEDGSFAQKWILEGKLGHPNLLTLLSLEDEHGSEKVGSKLREMMPWLAKP
jgi:ketol-acid reductoisomerase